MFESQVKRSTKNRNSKIDMVIFYPILEKYILYFNTIGYFLTQ